jgi:hypothetical protein
MRSVVLLSLAALAYAAQVASGRPVEAGPLPAAVFNVRDYGARGGARRLHDARIMNGSHKLTSATARFTAADVGQPVYIVGAGPKGGPHGSTIAHVDSAEVVTLLDAAAATVEEASLTIGPDETEAIARAIAAAAAAGGGTVHFPAGIYRITRELTIDASNIHLQGEGDGSVIYNSRMQFYGDNQEKNLQGGWTGCRVIAVGTPKHAIAHIEIDHLQVMNNGDQWVHASIGQPILMTNATGDYVTTDFHLHHVTLTTKSLNGYSNGGVLDRFSIHHLVVPETAKEAIYLAGRTSNGTVSENRLATTINPAISNIGIAGKGMRNVKIVRNTIRGKFWCAIMVTRPRILLPGQVFREEDVWIEDNRCVFDVHPHAADGIYVDFGARVTVVRNLVENAGAYGITFRAPDPEVSDVTIQDNTVRNTAHGYAISVMGGNNPARGPRNVVITGNRLMNNANGIEAWNVGGRSRIAGNLIQADHETKGAAFHVQPIAGASVECSANQTDNYRPGILNSSTGP